MRLIVFLACLFACCADTIKWTTSATGLKYTTVKKGSGPHAKTGNEVMIHETMRYANDSLIIDTRTLPAPIKVKIGANQAIAGVDEGLRGMKVGEVRKLIVPPALSKRSGNHTFPHPDSTLIYEIELIEIVGQK